METAASRREHQRWAEPLLRLDPMFDLLQNDPRFQKLAESEAPKDN